MAYLRSVSTLIIATKTDPASVNIANHLLSSYLWKLLHNSDEDESIIYKASSSFGSSLYLWYINQPLLTLNYANVLFNAQLSKSIQSAAHPEPEDILFLSRHAAASGTLSLTVHPVGIPWLTDNSNVGGIAGRCSPPSFRISSLYRAILSEAKAQGLTDKFEVTLEATHHGPYVEIPACFVEIGSNPDEWSNQSAGQVWCQILGKHLGLLPVADGSVTIEGIKDLSVDEKTDKPLADVFNSVTTSRNGVVVVTIGGGHYVPKMNDMARLGDGLYTGHALTSYSIKPYLDGSITDPVEGGWKYIVSEAINSTKLALPNAKLICMIDKGAFNAEQRKLLTEYLDELGIPHTVKTADVKKLWENEVK